MSNLANDFKEWLQTYVNEDRETLLGLAKISLSKIVPVFEAVFPQENASVILSTVIILGAVGADGTVDAKEKSFIQELFGIDSEAVDGIIKLHNGKEKEVIKPLVNAVDDDTKFAILNLVAVVLACDETIDVNEQRYILDLIL